MFRLLVQTITLLVSELLGFIATNFVSFAKSLITSPNRTVFVRLFAHLTSIAIARKKSLSEPIPFLQKVYIT